METEWRTLLKDWQGKTPGFRSYWEKELEPKSLSLSFAKLGPLLSYVEKEAGRTARQKGGSDREKNSKEGVLPLCSKGQRLGTF